MSAATAYAAKIRETVETLNRLVDCLNAEGVEVELDVFTMESSGTEISVPRIQQTVNVTMRKVTIL